MHDYVAFRSYYSTSRSLKKKQKKSQGSSRYRTGGDVELTALPLLKGGQWAWDIGVHWSNTAA